MTGHENKDATELSSDELRESGRTASYAGWRVLLDCDLCGYDFELDGDVSNGEVIECPGCGERVAVEGR